MARCRRCILSVGYPGISFDAEGVCNYCRVEGSLDDLTASRKQLLQAVEDVLTTVRGAAEYDCIVAFSGGKDSSFSLAMLVRTYHLRCLAVTVDNGFLSPVGLENCRRVTEALGCDFLVYKPDFTFMRTLYRRSLEGDLHVKAAIKRASSICSSCIGLINTYMIKLALRFHVPLIAGGYLAGQLPKDAAVIGLDQNLLRTFAKANLIRYGTRLGEEGQTYIALAAADIEQLGENVLRVVNPLAAMEYSEDAIRQTITSLGWQPPLDTGRLSSNCRLNDVGILSHLRRFGFHPYEAELADLVRKGMMHRSEALAKLEHLPQLDRLEDILVKLGIGKQEL